jgi:hypothetical protein
LPDQPFQNPNQLCRRSSDHPAANNPFWNLTLGATVQRVHLAPADPTICAWEKSAQSLDQTLVTATSTPMVTATKR